MMSVLVKTIRITPTTELEIRHGDLTQEYVDAIVNAANSHLAHGGGVAAAIIQAGGWVIQEESDEWVKKYGLVSHEKPAYTSGGKLPCRYVIHTIGPVWGEGDEDRKLTDAIKGSLALANELKLESISFPAISTGIFGFPKERAARIMLQSTFEYCLKPTSLKSIHFVLYDTDTLNVFTRQMKS
jgi:O-acetyl-ADP-ribose deacetylase (regulator of RNase III)